MANLLDELNATTLKVIRPKVIMDLAFRRRSPFLAFLREHALPHSGGAMIQNTFLYGKTLGGPYAKGETFDLTQQQILDVTKFDVRYYHQNDTQFREDIDVENKGAPAVFSRVKAHQEALMLTMNENLSVEVYRHGQASGSNISDNRVTSVNGMSEALNDGVSNSWDGNIFATYGQNTRNGTIGSSLNSVPFFHGDSTGAAGPITYANCLEQYLDACGGEWAPNLAVGNKAVFAYVLERLQPQQRFNNGGNEWLWGADSWNLMGMRFMRDEYAPSLRFGVNDARTGNWLTSTFTSASSPASASGLPSATTVTVGETLWFFNTKTFQMHLSDSEIFRFGWTGYKEAQNSTIVAGQLLVALNLLCQGPVYNKQNYGINS